MDWYDAAADAARAVARAPAAYKGRWGPQKSWQRGNLRTVSSKLPIEEEARFRALCAAEDVSPYMVVQVLVRMFMEVRGNG